MTGHQCVDLNTTTVYNSYKVTPPAPPPALPRPSVLITHHILYYYRHAFDTTTVYNSYKVTPPAPPLPRPLSTIHTPYTILLSSRIRYHHSVQQLQGNAPCSAPCPLPRPSVLITHHILYYYRHPFDTISMYDTLSDTSRPLCEIQMTDKLKNSLQSNLLNLVVEPIPNSNIFVGISHVHILNTTCHSCEVNTSPRLVLNCVELCPHNTTRYTETTPEPVVLMSQVS